MTAKTRIDLRYPKDRMLQNRARLEAVERFEYVDRVPVVFGFDTRFPLAERGISWSEYFSNPRVQMEHQLRNAQLILERTSDDRVAWPGVGVWPDFQNVTNASGCGCEIIWSDNDPPRAKSFLRTIDEAVAWRPEPMAGLWGKRLDWYQVMRELRDEFEVTFNGEPVEIGVGLGVNGDSPYMCALDMAGENFLAWLIEAPHEMNQFMTRITDAMIDTEKQYRQISGRPLIGGFGLSDDPVPMLSQNQYRQHIAPHTKRLYDTFAPVGQGARGMHLCGKNIHVLDVLMDDLKITSLDGYGYVNPPEAYCDRVAGNVVMRGNLDPMLLYNGPTDAIKKECHHIMEVLAPYGGIVLQDGYNVCPHTSWTFLDAMVEAAEEYGKPTLRKKK